MEKLGPGDPQRIGGYRLLARLGAGGMGQVNLARSDRGRTVAVKLVRPELAAREEFRARFRQEVRNAQRVGGFWTAPVLDADTEAAVPWVATGYVAGPSLQQVVSHDHGPLPERSVRILAAGLAHALNALTLQLAQRLVKVFDRDADRVRSGRLVSRLSSSMIRVAASTQPSCDRRSWSFATRLE